MRQLKITAILLLLTACMPLAAKQKVDKKVNQVDFSKVKIADRYWSQRLLNNSNATIPVCIDQIENKTARMQNFINVPLHGEHKGIYFDDSDVYKAIEGFAYSLINNPDPKLEAKTDEWIDHIAAAQQPDGYINTYFTLKEPAKRWTDIDKHEMYCAGHLIEAGIAYYKATGKDKLLNVGRRMADYMMTVFGKGKRHWVPGHEEIELALVKLADTTGKKKYLDFAYWLLEERGHGYEKGIGSNWLVRHAQSTAPVRDQRHITGHAVRAMYLFCGMADVAARRPNTGYMQALDSLWNDVVYRHMYVTGGIGNSKKNEGFTTDYDLPNAEAYCETCASIGMAFWNLRMNEATGEAKYIDVMERSIYNALLAGINLQGNRFFYVNPLESDGKHHRKEWYGTACCPSNLCRFIPSIGGYIYGTSDDALYVNLFIGNEATVNLGGKDVKVSMTTSYPDNGQTTITLGGATDKQVRVRIPGWCDKYTVKVNGSDAKYSLEAGYAVLEGPWKAGDNIELNFEMPVKVVTADPRVKADVGLRAIQRGPLVYCAEAADNYIGLDSLRLSPNETFNTHYDDVLLNGTTLIDVRSEGKKFRLIPYYLWDNRAAGKMKVWLPYDE